MGGTQVVIMDPKAKVIQSLARLGSLVARVYAASGSRRKRREMEESFGDPLGAIADAADGGSPAEDEEDCGCEQKKQELLRAAHRRN